MTKWEYKIIRNGEPGTKSFTDAEEFLNKLGQEGWEAVGGGIGGSSYGTHWIVVMKRPLWAYWTHWVRGTSPLSITYN